MNRFLPRGSKVKLAISAIEEEIMQTRALFFSARACGGGQKKENRD
jgi:hypothetical protein